MTKPKQRPNRSRSGAQTICPICGKKLRGLKGQQSHLIDTHEMTLEKAKQIVAPMKGKRS